MALGIGLTITNTKAVLEALVGTAERIRAHAEVPRRTQESRKCARRNIANVWAGCRGRVADRLLFRARRSITRIDNENYITVPFLVLFVFGYWYTGLMSLLQGRFAGLVASAETHTKPFPVGV